MLTIPVRLTFEEPLLGTAPLNDETYSDFIAAKAAKAGVSKDATDEELETLPVAKEIEKGTTGFHRDGAGTPFLYDYQISGFFKDACGALRRIASTESKKLKAYRKEIVGLIFVKPRRIRLMLPEGGKITTLERPLRAEMQQGPRVALARSEQAPAGTSIEFTVQLLNEKHKMILLEWLEYGELKGLGQWRNGGYGRFGYELLSPATA